MQPVLSATPDPKQLSSRVPRGALGSSNQGNLGLLLAAPAAGAYLPSARCSCVVKGIPSCLARGTLLLFLCQPGAAGGGSWSWSNQQHSRLPEHLALIWPLLVKNSHTPSCIFLGEAQNPQLCVRTCVYVCECNMCVPVSAGIKASVYT